MKICFKCNLGKPLEDFYAHPRMTDGHLGKCKDCAKVDANSRCLANPEKIKQYEKSRNQDPIRRAARQAYNRRHSENNPDKKSARALIWYAVKTGKVDKMPCINCGDIKSEAHHEDYSKPLDVIWLCRKHHREHHCGIHAKAKSYLEVDQL